MRIQQRAGTRGSLKFIQRLVSRHPDLLASRLRGIGAVAHGAEVRWVSPREDDNWAEYRDAAFLERLGRTDLVADLREFWPSRGPQWDALGVAGDTLLLVEAKAHVGELASSCTAKSDRSRALIEKSLNATKRALGARENADWMHGCYQLANRLAHLQFLQERGADARLVLLSFTGKTDMPTPSTPAAYEDAFRSAMQHLGLDTAPPVAGMVLVYVDVGELECT